VAVLSFTNPSYSPAFSTFLVDRLNILLASSHKQFDVVTRDRIEEAFHEINLALGKNYDASTFAKIGKAVGAKALVSGSYVVMQGNAKVSVTAQLLDVQTGRIIGGGFADIPYTGDVKTMLTPQELSPGGPASGALPAQEQQSEVSGFVFRLKQCTASRTAVSCKFVVTSPEHDRHISAGIAGNGTIHSVMYDQGNGEYQLSQISMANKIGQGGVEAFLVRDVPTQVDLTFSVTTNVSNITLLRFAVGDNDRNIVAVGEFRNIRPK
jgi:TolB-like protein